ncbi:MAG: DUF4236 domain-containing protein [Cyanobacteria bacterium REEB498]|nr:DUF4236 domain-containing protein [Cyanobacteria bacterium REEB498]
MRANSARAPLRFNFSGGGLSSISVGGRGASFNIPVNRSGGPRTTVGLPNCRRLRPGQLDWVLSPLHELLLPPVPSWLQRDSEAPLMDDTPLEQQTGAR